MMVRALTDAVERAGTDRNTFLAEAEIDPLRLTDIHAHVSGKDYRRTVSAAYKLAADPALGLHMGECISLSSFDVLGRLPEHSSCLRDALSSVVRYSRIVSDGTRLELVETADTARIQMHVHNPDTPEGHLAAELFCVWIMRVVRIFAGDGALPLHVLFSYPRPLHHAEYTMLFGGVERFSQPHTGVEIERAWLDQRSPDHASELLSYLLSRAESLLARVDREGSTTERVKRWIESQGELAQPSLAQAAHALGTSARSLRRRLHEESTHFSVLVDAARANLAKSMLLDHGHGIQDTAYAVGFRTPAAFSRAFKRWTGMGPKAYREAHERGLQSPDSS